MTTLAIVLKLVLIMMAMLYIGVSTKPSEARAVLANRNLIVRAALANLVLVPALGVLLVLVLPLSPDTAAGILLLTLAPSGINAVQFSSKVTSQIATAAAVTFALTIVSFIIAPIVAVTLRIQTSRPPLPYLTLLDAMLVLVIGPIAWAKPCASVRQASPGKPRTRSI